MFRRVTIKLKEMGIDWKKMIERKFEKKIFLYRLGRYVDIQFSLMNNYVSFPLQIFLNHINIYFIS